VVIVLRPGALARFSPVMEAVANFAKEGGPVLGICNAVGSSIARETHGLPGGRIREDFETGDLRIAPRFGQGENARVGHDEFREFDDFIAWGGIHGGTARAQRSGGWNPQLSMAAIARFATPKALPRIRAIYESQQDPCQPELVAYFVRVDPAYSERVFRSHAWDMQAPPPRCTVQYFNRTPPLAMNPALERYIAAYLMHSDVYIKSTAAQVLARYGTASALPRLWETFRYFHDYWNGKGADLAQNGQGVGLEVGPGQRYRPRARMAGDGD